MRRQYQQKTNSAGNISLNESNAVISNKYYSCLSKMARWKPLMVRHATALRVKHSFPEPLILMINVQALNVKVNLFAAVAFSTCGVSTLAYLTTCLTRCG